MNTLVGSRYEIRIKGTSASIPPEGYSGYTRLYNEQNNYQFSYDLDDVLTHIEEIVTKGHYTKEQLEIVLVTITATVIRA